MGIEIHGQEQQSIGKDLYQEWERCSSIKEEQDCFHSNPDGVTFVGHNFQTFVEIVIDALNQHTVVISTREDMSINLQEVNGLFAHTKEFAILVQDDSVAKAKSQLDFRDT